MSIQNADSSQRNQVGRTAGRRGGDGTDLSGQRLAQKLVHVEIHKRMLADEPRLRSTAEPGPRQRAALVLCRQTKEGEASAELARHDDNAGLG